MRNRLYSFLLLFTCILSTPALKAQTPIEFNHKLVTITDSLVSKGKQWSVEFNQARESKDFTQLATSRQQLERFVDQKIAEVGAMTDVKDSKQLRLAMLNFLVFEKGMITGVFKPFENLGKNPAAERINAALKSLDAYSAEGRVALSRVNAAQAAYTKANGF